MTGPPSSDILAALDFPAPTLTCDWHPCTRNAIYTATLRHCWDGHDCQPKTLLICGKCANDMLCKAARVISIAFFANSTAYCRSCNNPIRTQSELVSAKPL